MLILYDCTSAQPNGNIVINGGGEYSLRILEEIVSKINKTDEVILLTDRRRGINKVIDKYCNGNIKKYSYEDLADLESYIELKKPERLIFPIFYPSYSEIHVSDGIEVVGLIHDMSTFHQAYLGEHPGKYYKLDGLNWLRKIVNVSLRHSRMNKYLAMHEALFKLNNSTNVYTVSYYTKSILEYFLREVEVKGVYYSPLKVVEDIDEVSEKKILELYGIEKNKFLLLSNIGRWTKNNMRVIVVLDKMFSNQFLAKMLDGYNVVLVGSNERLQKYLQKKIINKDKFIIKKYIPSMDMEILYKNAYIYIYPSLLEGFGYPPIEAMRYDTVSLCSTSTSIPEICGEAAIYFNPISDDSILLAIMRAFDLEYYNIIKKRIPRHYQMLTAKQDADLKSLVSRMID